MSKYAEVRCDFYDEDAEVQCIDAWLTDDDNEDGMVIAKANLATGDVEYLDDDARTDEYAQEVIREVLENKYVLTE